MLVPFDTGSRVVMLQAEIGQWAPGYAHEDDPQLTSPEDDPLMSREPEPDEPLMSVQPEEEVLWSEQPEGEPDPVPAPARRPPRPRTESAAPAPAPKPKSGAVWLIVIGGGLMLLARRRR